jgi:hypothetical protein
MALTVAVASDAPAVAAVHGPVAALQPTDVTRTLNGSPATAANETVKLGMALPGLRDAVPALGQSHVITPLVGLI